MVETTDASKAAEDVSPSISPPNATKALFLQFFLFLFSFHPSYDYLLHQTFPEETPTQEQESNSLPIENDPIVVVT